MILNNYLLMRKIKRLINEELTLDMILDLHRIATFGSDENGNIAGKFRQSDDIVIRDGNDTILYQPPLHTLIEKRLQAVCDFANTQHLGEEEIFIHPIIKAIMLHFMILKTPQNSLSSPPSFNNPCISLHLFKQLV